MERNRKLEKARGTGPAIKGAITRPDLLVGPAEQRHERLTNGDRPAVNEHAIGTDPERLDARG